MAIYHLNARTGSRAGGQSAAAKSDYILRSGKYARGAADEVLYSQSGNMPGWAVTGRDYWEAADLGERANGRLFKEIEFALPVELTLEQQQALAEQFAQHLTGDERLPWTLAIHAGRGSNPHCHLMISERQNDGLERSAATWFSRYNAKQPQVGGARKTESLKPKEWLEQIREAWSEHANRALKRAGHDSRIDHRTLLEQGIERLPTQHIGPAGAGYERRTGQPSRRRQDFEQDALARLATARDIGEQERRVEAVILDLSGDLAQARGARASIESGEAWRRRAAAEAAVQQWRADHPRKAWLHDHVGYMPELRELEQAQEAAASALAEASGAAERWLAEERKVQIAKAEARAAEPDSTWWKPVSAAELEQARRDWEHRKALEEGRAAPDRRRGPDGPEL